MPSTAAGGGLERLRKAFDAEHDQLFSFVLDAEHELVTVRATANGPRPDVTSIELEKGGEDPAAAQRTTHAIWVEGGEVEANVYDRDPAQGRQRRPGSGHRHGDGLHHAGPSRARRDGAPGRQPPHPPLDSNTEH